MNRKLFGAALAVVLSLAIVDAADAHGRRGSATIHTPRGDAVATGEVNRGRGVRTRESAVTGPGGRTRSVEDARTWGGGERSHDRTTTYRDGTSRTVDADAQRTAPGGWSATRTVTGRDGETRTQTGDFSVTRTEDGRSVTGNIDTQNHGQVDYTRDVTHGDGARSVNATATFEDGTSITRASSGACTSPGNCASSGAVTNRQGETTSWTQSRTRDGADATRARDVTYSDGTTRSVDVARDGNGDGTGSVTRVVTGRNGETRTQTGDYAVTPAP